MSSLAALSAAAGVFAGLLLAALPLSRQRRALRITRYQAHHDDTTGLPNRRALIAAVDDANRGGQPYGLVLLDLDGFKQVNDRYGHETGNDLLTAVGRSLAELPHPVRLAARLSGDEFAVLVHGGPDDTFRAARLAAAATEAASVTADAGRDGAAAVAVAASVGYTVSRLGVSIRDLLREADEAMYRAKRGTDRICRFQPVTATTQPHTGRCRDRR